MRQGFAAVFMQKAAWAKNITLKALDFHIFS